ncbi:MAG TPA: threonine synthase [Pseudomonadales bacterium]|nr:threonine synthase [Pseudomonadales bacterium]
MTDLPTFVSHLECSMTGETFPADQVHGLSPVGRPLLVRYDLEGLRAAVDKDRLARRTGGVWRWSEFLPVRRAENRLDLGELVTPMVHTPEDGAPELWVKDEGRLPTGSFKARGLGVAVSMAKELGLTHLAMPTNGNAGAALAAYCRRGGLQATVFCPADTPEVNVREIALQGADVYRVDGLINDCGKIVGAGRERIGWFDLSTLKEPYRIEGKKTMGLELAEQFAWQLPDAIFYPTGGGTGLIGMWKAFDELEALGWIGPERPKMFAVQAEGCAPIVRAFERGEEHAPVWENAHTMAAGIRVPVADGDFLILRAVRASGGAALAVSDEDIVSAQAAFAERHGLLLCPEGAATRVAWEQAVDAGLIDRSARSVLFNCATGLKYPMPPSDRHFDADSDADWTALAERSLARAGQTT